MPYKHIPLLLVFQTKQTKSHLLPLNLNSDRRYEGIADMNNENKHKNKS
jgi:hypothetical protein